MMYDVVIIGSGPAGLTAAIYTTRANLKTLVVGGATWGGQLMLTTVVENFPGFPDGIEGSELMAGMRKQAEGFGAEMIDANFVSGDFRKAPFLIKTEERSVEAKAVIIATGANAKWLGVAGEREKIGRGVSTCAPCDGPFFKNKDIIVAGGGDSAMEEAVVLTKYARSVTVVHRRDEFRASPIMVDKARNNEKIGFLLNSRIVEIMGEQKVEKVRIASGVVSQELREMIKKKGGVVVEEGKDKIVWEMPIDGVFVAIGHVPNSKVFAGIEVDKGGYIKVGDHFRTNIEGVFAAGDVYDKRYKQAIVAAGTGAAVALETQWWLENVAA